MIKRLKKDEVIELVTSKRDDYIYAISMYHNDPFKSSFLYEKLPVHCCQLEIAAWAVYLQRLDHSLGDDEDPVIFECKLDDDISFKSTHICIFFQKEKDAEFISNEFRKRGQKYQQDHDVLHKKMQDHLRIPRPLASVKLSVSELMELYHKAFQPVIDKYIKS